MSLLGSEITDQREQFLASARAAREARAQERERENAVLKIQAGVRGYFVRKRVFAEIRGSFTANFEKYDELDKSLSLIPPLEGFVAIRRFMLLVFDDLKDKEIFLCACRYLLLSLDCNEVKSSIISVALSKDHLLSWIRTIKQVLWQCCKYSEDLRPEMPADTKAMNLLLHVLVSFTACNTWALLKTKSGEALKPSANQICSNVLGDLCTRGLYTKLNGLLKKGLCRRCPAFKHATLSAAVSLALRPLTGSNFSDNMMTQFTVSILSVPGLIFHMNTLAQECMTLFITNQIFVRTIGLLTNDLTSRKVFHSLDGGYTMCVLANLIHLGFVEKQVLVEHLLDFTNAATRLFDTCVSHVVTKKSTLTHWHPVFGWYGQALDAGLQEAMPHVTQQLQLLWNGSTVKCLFSDLVNLVPEQSPSISPDGTHHVDAANRSKQNATSGKLEKELAPSVRNLLKKLFDPKLSRDLLSSQSGASGSSKGRRFGSPETTVVALVCSLYQTALHTMTQLKYDILSGLCYQDFLLPRLWHFISALGSQNGLKAFLEMLAVNPKATSPEFQILILFCDAATYLITILDDIELYERQKPFELQQLVAIGQFCNQLIYRSIWENLVDMKSVYSSPLINSVHGLLMLLYNRDCRRSFTNQLDFWLIKDVKPSSLLSELEKGNKKAEFLIQRVPHIIPHKDRVVLFRKYIHQDRESLGLHGGDSVDRSSTLITIQRGRLVEDGYRQLSLLPVKALKGVIRVKFVNEQGLDEPGIDQDGVFKEFLEETIKKVIDPTLNLFRTTSEGRLYPSSTSNVHENHLALFDFVGRMLAKAVYEGIVVEVPFATFFMNHILGKASSSSYSSIDELPSLDHELYNSLAYLKHYEGSVVDLDLTFSCDEDYMGQMITHELVPGGRIIPVNNENRISYIHLMAHFRMYVQIRDQLTAFVRAFRSVIRSEWLALFSAPELQKLISGDAEHVDLQDLRRHVQYYGGFHNNHRVINWLWEILEQDFTSQERGLFLKFVTSCSKPPLLGFEHLEPPFSIRCVEVADDQDEGDTLGSVIRGFLAIRKRDPVGRLPTAATCFNLLKLPNYQKKSTLRDKLRYAIHSGTGFELS